MAFEKINSKVVTAQVSGHNPVLSRRGAMLGYSGNVSFRPVHGQGQGVGGMVGAMMAGESVRMMASEGDGLVYYGFRGLHVEIINLTGDSLTVEANRILAHDANLQTSIEMITTGVRSAVRGAMTGQGLATTKIFGQGSVAVMSHGGAFPMQLNGETVGVDPQAYVGHVGGLQVELKSSVGMRDLVGRGSGEAFQLQVSGHGTVYVQASEKKF